MVTLILLAAAALSGIARAVHAYSQHMACRLAAVVGKETMYMREKERVALHLRLYQRYIHAMSRIIEGLRRLHLYHTASVFGSLACEARKSLQLNLLHGYADYEIDPDYLIPEQTHLRPVLCLHSKFGKKGQFMPLVSYLQSKQPMHRPVFSVSLPDNGPVSERDVAIIRCRLEEIATLYPVERRKRLRVDLVGYSRGGEAAILMALEGIREEKGRYTAVGSPRIREGIGKIILLASPLSHDLLREASQLAALYEIDADWDILVKKRSQIRGRRSRRIRRCGHLGLIVHPEAVRQIVEWLQEELSPSPEIGNEDNKQSEEL